MAKKQAPKEEMEIDINEIVVRIPIGDGHEVGYQQQLLDSGELDIESRGVHVNVQLGRKATIGFAMARSGLRQANARLADGRPVWTNAEVLRYIFDAIADSPQSHIPGK